MKPNKLGLIFIVLVPIAIALLFSFGVFFMNGNKSFLVNLILVTKIDANLEKRVFFSIVTISILKREKKRHTFKRKKRKKNESFDSAFWSYILSLPSIRS